MSLPQTHPRLTYAEYLVIEDAREYHAEFFDGEIWAMSGGTAEHALLISNLTIAMGSALRGRPCRAYSEALRVYFPDLAEAAYPDLKIICGPVEHDPADPLAATNPTVLVEVLSDGTEAFDRGEKFARYRTLGSMQEYLLVDQHEVRLELFRRNADGTWTLTVAEAGHRLRLDSIDIEIEVDQVYDAVDRKPRVRPTER